MKFVRVGGSAVLCCLILLAGAGPAQAGGGPVAQGSSVPIAHAADRDCADFPNQAAAQSYFVSRGGPGSDPDRLDGDNDGLACDSLPCPCSYSAAPPYVPPYVPPAEPTEPVTKKTAKTYLARITKVVDGDTIKVRLSSGARRTVRLLGIDTPETKRPGVAVECGGRQATDSMVRSSFAKGVDTNKDRLLDAGKGRGRRVILRTDPTQDTTDRYGRLLAYARTSQNVELQVAQLRRGWAAVYVYNQKPFERTATYQAASDQAKARGKGAWSRCGGNFHTRARAAAPTVQARAAASKCSITRVYPQAYNGGPAPVGKVRVRRLSCRSARVGMADWFDAYQDRIRAGRKASVTYIEISERPFRCVYRQTPYGRDRNGDPINPYAVVKCRARGGVRLYFEGYG